MRIAVIGATGLVGHQILAVLHERRFAFTELLCAASPRSVGHSVPFGTGMEPVTGIEAALDARPDIALFSAGSAVALEYAPRFAAAGCRVIDNSSAFRLQPNVPLIVPEVNADAIGNFTQHPILANPNCSTIQLVVALHPLHLRFGLKRVVVSTYQSVTGTGESGKAQLEAEQRGTDFSPETSPYAHPIHQNAIPHCDVFGPNGYTREEMKLVHESRKILGLPDLALTATAVRVPVVGGHSEAVNAEFLRKFSLEEARHALASAPGIRIVDDPANNTYPTPLQAQHQDDVLVGRLRMDESQARTLNLFIVADNLRKGAATNAVQIAELVARQASV